MSDRFKMCNYYFLYCSDYRKLDSARNKLHTASKRYKFRYISYPGDFTLPGLPTFFKENAVGVRMPGIFACIFWPGDSSEFNGFDVMASSVTYEHFYSQLPELEAWFDDHCKVKGFRDVVERTSYGMVRTRAIPVVRPAKKVRTDKPDYEVEFLEEMTRDNIPIFRQLYQVCLKEVGDQFGSHLCGLQNTYILDHKKEMIRYRKAEYAVSKGKDPDGFYSGYMYDIRRVFTDYFHLYLKLFYALENEWARKVDALYRLRERNYCIKNKIDVPFVRMKDIVEVSSLYELRRYLRENFVQVHPSYIVNPISVDASVFVDSLIARVMPFSLHLQHLSSFSPKPKPKVVIVGRK